jgi:hypothetical protein
MIKNCGKCEHFVQMDGMFGGCTDGQRERFDHETFSSVPACKAFKPIETEGCTCGNCNNEHLGQPPMGYDGHPMGSMMSMLMNMPPGTMMTMGAGLPPGMGGPQGPPTETKGPWVNPLIKNPKPPKAAKVVNLEAWRLEKGK